MIGFLGDWCLSTVTDGCLDLRAVMCTAAPFGRLSHCVDCSVVSFVVLSWAGGLGFVPGPGRDAGCFVFVVDFPFVFLMCRNNMLLLVLTPGGSSYPRAAMLGPLH